MFKDILFIKCSFISAWNKGVVERVFVPIYSQLQRPTDDRSVEEKWGRIKNAYRLRRLHSFLGGPVLGFVSKSLSSFRPTLAVLGGRVCRIMQPHSWLRPLCTSSATTETQRPISAYHGIRWKMFRRSVFTAVWHTDAHWGLVRWDDDYHTESIPKRGIYKRNTSSVSNIHVADIQLSALSSRCAKPGCGSK